MSNIQLHLLVILQFFIIGQGPEAFQPHINASVLEFTYICQFHIGANQNLLNTWLAPACSKFKLEDQLRAQLFKDRPFHDKQDLHSKAYAM